MKKPTPPRGVVRDKLPQDRGLNYFRKGDPVLVLWKGRWLPGVVEEHVDNAPELTVRFDKYVGGPHLDGYGLMVGSCSEEIWRRTG
jgi:hypothetical protein